MITKFKIFEMIKISSSSKNPRINSYVVVNIDINIYFSRDVSDRIIIMNNNICQIKNIISQSYLVGCVGCDEIGNYTRWISDLSIIVFSDNKEDLEPILLSKKYNL